MNRIISPLLIGVALLGMPIAGQALCNIHGSVIRVQINAATVNENKLIYMRADTSAATVNSNLNAYYYYARTADDVVVTSAATAMASGTRTFLSTDIASCPTTGEARFIGNVRGIILGP